jgi:hypothetical protein
MCDLETIERETMDTAERLLREVVEAAEQAMLKGGITNTLLISSVRGAIQEVYRLSSIQQDAQQELFEDPNIIEVSPPL